MRSIQIQLTTKCNQKCIMCRKYTWKHKEIELDVLFEKMGKYANATITFSGGDPLEYSHLKELNEYLVGNKRIYQVFTNLTYELNSYMYDFLANAKHVQVSLDGHDEESYRAIRGKNVMFNTLIKNTKLLNNIKFNVVLLRTNYIHIEDLASLAYFLNVPIRFFPVHTHDELALTEYQKNDIDNIGASIIENNYSIYSNTNLRYLHGMFYREKPSKCFVKLHHRVVDEDGIEYPCCRAINDNGEDWSGKHACSNIEGIEDIAKLYEFCNACDRYVKPNLNWGFYEGFDVLFL